MAKTDYKTVDEYIGLQSEIFREPLKALRKLIQEVVPSAEETISYQMPMYKLHGMLVGFAAFTAHYTFSCADAVTLSSFSDRLTDYKFSKSALQIQLNQDLPKDVIKDIIAAKLASNLEKKVK